MVTHSGITKHTHEMRRGCSFYGQPWQAAGGGTDNTQLCSHRSFIEYLDTGVTTCLQAEGLDLCHGNFVYDIGSRELGGSCSIAPRDTCVSRGQFSVEIPAFPL